MTKEKQQHIYSLVALVSVIVFIYILSKNIPEETVREFIKSAGPWGPIVFILFMLLTYIAAPISGTPFLLMGFYLFGQMAVVYAATASIFSNAINFWIARMWGRGIVERLAGEKSLKQIDKMTNEYGYQSLFFLRLFLIGLHDVISYGAGLTKMKFVPYFIISIVAMIPARAVEYYLATLTQNPAVLVGFIFLEIFIFGGLFFIGSKLWKWHKMRKRST